MEAPRLSHLTAYKVPRLNYLILYTNTCQLDESAVRSYSVCSNAVR